MSDGIPVYACERDDYRPGQAPDGYAVSKSEAARIIRRAIARRDGDPDSGIRADDVGYSRELNAYFIEG